MHDSEYCKHAPDDPRCQTPHSGDKMDDMEIMKSQMVFLMTAVSATMHAALRTFRYRSADTYYVSGDSLSTNYWKMLIQGADYFTMVFMGIASITQLLSMLGIAAEINLMVWMYGGMVDMVVSLIWGLVAMYAVDAYWSDSENTGSSTQATSSTALGMLEDDMTNMVALETGAAVGLYIHHKGWMMGQWNALSDEAKEMIWEDAEEKEDDEMDMMVSHLFRF